MNKQDILNELAWFSEPLFEAAHDQQNLISLLKQFGYDPDPTHLDTLHSGLSALTNSIALILQNIDDDPGDFDLANLAEVYKAIYLLGENATVRSYFGNSFFHELFDYLLVHYLSFKKPFLQAVLYSLGVIEQNSVEKEIRGVSYTQIKLNWERIPDFIGDTKKWAKEVYGWNGDPTAGDPKPLDYELLIAAIALLFESSGHSIVLVKELTAAELTGFISNLPAGKLLHSATIPIVQSDLDRIESDGTPIFKNEAGLRLLPYGSYNDVKNLGVAVSPYAKGAVDTELPLAEKTKLNITLGATAHDLAFITIQPTGIAAKTGGGVTLKFAFEIKYAEDPEAPMSLITIGEKTKLEVSAIKAVFGGDLKGDFYVSGGMEKLKATIDLSETPLLGSFISEPFIIDAGDISVKWQSGKGVSFEGGNNLAITLPTHIQAGPLHISALGLSLNFGDKPDFTFDFTGKLALGPLELSVDAVGFKTSLVKTTNGIFGNYSPQLDFKPPKGLGLAINAGVVMGGGYLYFDFEKEEYAGALELTIAGFIAVKAIGLITTKMPDNSKGFSLLVIITAEFFPPFQLGFGFTLNAVGGLLGLNRTVLLDPLREGVRTGAVNNIMFPTNVIANAPRIISDLRAIFPPYPDKFLIGPMAKLGWGTPSLITLSFGLIIEIPGNIAILGVLRIILPDEAAAIIKIQVAFVGTIDFDRKMLTFDASLFESSILQTMTLEGDMAVRIAWGDQPNFVVTVGGFHPSFTPPPLALPTLKRLSINLLNTSISKIRVEFYQAVTSNTVQFGAKAEVRLDLRVCSISGHIAFDALIQFNPFYFIISLSAGFKLKAAGISLMSVRVNMSLEGPTPWRAQGTGRVSLLFIKISANFDITWGEKKNTSLPEISILPQFLEQLQKKEQWSTALSTGKNLLVSLRKFEQTSESLLVLHPAGSLLVQQKLLPLQVNFDKIGNQKTADVKQLTIQSAASNGTTLQIKEVKEDFARAQYQNLSDADKLSKPSFEKMQGGVEISMANSSVKNGKMVRRKIEYELTIIDKEPVKPFAFGKYFIELGSIFSHFLKGNSVTKSNLSKSYREKLQPFDAKLEIETELYTVAYQSNNKAFTNQATFPSEMEAASFMQDKIRENPALKKQIHVVPQYELQEI